MDFDASLPAQPHESPDRLSPSGQMIGWAVFGSLVVAGFIFGVVTGYERPKTAAVSKASKEPEPARTDAPKTDAPKPTTKLNPEPAATQPIVAARETAPPKPTTPKDAPKPPTPVATKPKEDPKPPMPVVATPPKTDPPVKKEDVKAVSFKQVLPVLRTHCLDCHGGGKGKPKGDVDLTTVEKIVKSPSPGKILVPGKPEQSDIYTSITLRDMPDGGKPKPSKDELLLLKNWILSGAKERRRVVRRRR